MPKFCLGKNVFRGLSSGGDESLVKQAFDKDAAALSDFCQKADVLIILLGLGGGTGNGAALGLIKLALQSGAFVIVIPILPFSFEGQTKGVRAQGALKAIKLMADLVIPFYNDVLFQSLTETATVKEAFNDGNRWLSQLNSMLVNYLSNDKSAALNGTLNTFVQHFSDKPDHIFWGLGSHEQGDIGQALKSVFEGPFWHPNTNDMPIKRVFIFSQLGSQISLVGLKNLNYEIQCYLGTPDIQILSAYKELETEPTHVHIFVLGSHYEKNLSAIRYRKNGMSAAQGQQIQFDFEAAGQEAYWDTPTYLRLGLKLE